MIDCLKTPLRAVKITCGKVVVVDDEGEEVCRVRVERPVSDGNCNGGSSKLTRLAMDIAESIAVSVNAYADNHADGVDETEAREQFGHEHAKDQYYLQDSRGYVGNDMQFWANDGNGYTTDVSKAHVYTKAEVIAHNLSRETDIPWPKEYIDAHTRPAVDVQHVSRETALAGTGIFLRQTVTQKKETYRCHGCGRIMSVERYYCAPCKHCGMDNRP